MYISDAPYTTLYAAFGMNTNLAQMANRCPKSKPLGRLDIPDYRLVFRGVADIEESYGDILQTVLWEITNDCELSLDILEGYPHFYNKTYVEIDINNQTEFVMLYQMNEYIRDYNEPSKYYEQLLLEGYTEFGLDVNQIYNAVGYRLDNYDLDYLGKNYYDRYSY
jgi:hypothetical protein